MPSAYATKVGEAFSAKVMEHFYAKSLAPVITNQDFKGEIGQMSKLNILNFAKVSEKTYAGSAMSPDSLTETNSILNVDQYKSFYVKALTIDEFKSYVKNPLDKVSSQCASERKKNLDAYLLGLYADCASGNWIGTSYTTGTVTVDVTTGAVTGSGTTFNSAMVGKPFKALGHTKWYRVKTYSSTTSIVIENDSDDETSAYDGGAIAGGATYEVQANTVLTLTTSNILSTILKAKQFLDENEVPEEDRVLIVPPVVANLMPQTTGITLQVPAAYEELVKKGYMMELAGFKVFQSSRLAGNNTTGYYALAIQKNWLTFADRVLWAKSEEDLPGDFGVAVKDLYVYGAKVADVRRKAGCVIWCKV